MLQRGKCLFHPFTLNETPLVLPTEYSIAVCHIFQSGWVRTKLWSTYDLTNHIYSLVHVINVCFLDLKLPTKKKPKKRPRVSLVTLLIHYILTILSIHWSIYFYPSIVYFTVHLHLSIPITSSIHSCVGYLFFLTIHPFTFYTF